MIMLQNNSITPDRQRATSQFSMIRQTTSSPLEATERRHGLPQRKITASESFPVSPESPRSCDVRGVRANFNFSSSVEFDRRKEKLRERSERWITPTILFHQARVGTFIMYILGGIDAGRFSLFTSTDFDNTVKSY